MRVLLLFVLAGTLWASLDESVRMMLSPREYESHRRLIALLFENEGAYCRGDRCDVAKIARTLRENGLLSTKLPAPGEVVLTMACPGEHPLFFMKEVSDTLHGMGLSGLLTKEAKMDGEGFSWSLSYHASEAPDPVTVAERFARRGIALVGIERIDADHWRYRLDMREARIDALPLRDGEVRKVVRPLRPVWVDVSGVRRLTIRELPGSHWYADVAVYDKMLRILSLKQNDTRTRYLRLRLPKEAAYVRIGDRYTLENIRSGLGLAAQGER